MTLENKTPNPRILESIQLQSHGIIKLDRPWYKEGTPFKFKINWTPDKSTIYKIIITGKNGTKKGVTTYRYSSVYPIPSYVNPRINPQSPFYDKERKCHLLSGDILYDKANWDDLWSK